MHHIRDFFKSAILSQTSVFFFALMSLYLSVTVAQTKYPTDYFRHPMNLPVSMAGDFAEIRSNHFHSGIDLRTGGKEGEKVYAPADGYVSRINISAWGGGKVLYITHPNGYRTVYMHLSAFCGEIGKFVSDYQNSHQTYAFDTELPKDSIPVKKGQLVALSGNTGGSAGPHLHYEIRYASNDQPINPLYFGINYEDPIAPTIAGVKIYPATPSTLINGKNNEMKVGSQNDEITVSGRFYTGIFTYDRMETGSNSKNGVEKIELYVDDTLFHRYQVSTFMFEETRGINAVIDYQQFQRNREYYILSRRLQGDRSNYNTVVRDNGYLSFSDNNTHTLEYRVSDYKGNTSRFRFRVKAISSKGEVFFHDTGIHAKGEPITYYKRFNMLQSDFSVEMEPYTVYSNDMLAYSVMKDADGLTPLHRIELVRHPLPPHQSFTVHIAVPKSVPTNLRDKLTVVCISGKKISACYTRLKGEWLEASTRSFGGFSVRLDTVAPTVAPVNFTETKAFNGNELKVKIGDNLSGVDTYKCFVNGKWALAEHDGKTSSLTVNARYLKKGENTVTFRITDAAGNAIEETWKIRRP